MSVSDFFNASVGRYPANVHSVFHAHVYFDEQTLGFATRLCHRAGEQFGIQVGRVHQQRVGPHPAWSCQLLFKTTDFEQLIPWLDAQRCESAACGRTGLSILVHGVTGDHLKDHTEHAYWLGQPLVLDLSMFQ
ncbi:DOPA 4,5-dioxygenase family protein [Oceanospirillum linum]|uniref:4,5-dioxygenase n=1 Tax=Oceanospirillum linum TaxID=966 RepID=A0A1T1H7Z3_OCELI|nr:DOPA 4,5-dioxygenase family protein [Oceanospirillum linum]OOV85963.1 4,5-dioxygenase [Oceanospirillum linum]SEG44924.1 DOPA 4,5-dioxygenase [Oleiphilus messinensis]SMP34418.1 DOPA 4,5-dioxygenase [Oceanospirillum linum]